MDRDTPTASAAPTMHTGLVRVSPAFAVSAASGRAAVADAPTPWRGTLPRANAAIAPWNAIPHAPAAGPRSLHENDAVIPFGAALCASVVAGASIWALVGYLVYGLVG